MRDVQKKSAGKATIHFDASGKIYAVVLASQQPGLPPGGIMRMPGMTVAEVDIPPALAGAPIIDLHRNFRIIERNGIAHLTPHEGNPSAPSAKRRRSKK